MRDTVIQLCCAVLGTVGFGVLFNEKRVHLIFSCFIGLVCWGSYLVLEHLGSGVFVASFLSAAICELMAEIASRIKHSPTTVFFISGIVSLIPGSALFYTLSNMINGNNAEAMHYAGITALTVLGISVGMGIVMALFYSVKKLIKDIKGRQRE